MICVIMMLVIFMLNIKIAFFDLDGTLLNNQQKITIKSKEALEYLKSKNIILVLATGRFDAYALKFAEELKIIDYIISNNGALIYDVKNNNYIFEEKFDNLILEELWNYTDNNELGITLNAKGHRYSNKYSTTSDAENTIINSLNKLPNDIYQIVFSGFDRKKITNLLEYLKNINIRVTYISNVYYTNEKSSISVDITLPHINKGSSALKLMDKLNIDGKKSICFGDGSNDLDIFEVCNYKVAMENGKKELKDKATHVTLSNVDEGVSNFIFNNIK